MSDLEKCIEEAKRVAYAINKLEEEEYEDDECEHKWVYQGSDYEKRERNRYENTYKKIDTYYCEKCLEIKEIVVKDEDSEKKPYWYKG